MLIPSFVNKSDDSGNQKKEKIPLNQCNTKDAKKIKCQAIPDLWKVKLQMLYHREMKPQER
jgi:hypothetical protein